MRDSKVYGWVAGTAREESPLVHSTASCCKALTWKSLSISKTLFLRAVHVPDPLQSVGDGVGDVVDATADVATLLGIN